MTLIGEAFIALRPQPADDFEGEAKKGILGPLKGIAIAAGGLFAAKIGTDFLGGAIDSASDFNETLSKSKVVFGNSSKDVEAFAATAARSLGQSKQQALDAASSFGNLFVSMKIGQPEAAKMSTGIVKLASDLASFNNQDPAAVLASLRSGLVGETEPLRQFGVNLSAAAIEAKAMQLGLNGIVADSPKVVGANLRVEAATKAVTEAIKKHGKDSFEARKATNDLALAQDNSAQVLQKSGGSIDAAAKAQATYALILEQTATAQDDFAETSGGMANKQRIQAAQMEDLKIKIGQGLLPVMVAVTGFMTDKVVPVFGKYVPMAVDAIQAKITELTPTFKAVFETVQGIVDGFAAFFDGKSEQATAATSKLKEVIASIAPLFQAVFTAVRTIVSTAVAIIMELWDRFGGQLVGHLKVQFDALMQVVRGAFTVLTGIFDFVTAILTGKWGDAWDALKKIAAGALDAVVGVVRVAINMLSTVIGAGMAVLSLAWSGVWAGMKAIVTTVFIDPVKGLINGLVDFFANLPDRIGRVTLGMWDGITEAFRHAINAIIRGWNSLEFKLPSFSLGPVHFGGETIGMPNIPTLHDGGLFRAPAGQREGLALLRDGEMVTTPEQRAGGPLIGQMVVNTPQFNLKDQLRRAELLRPKVRVA